MAPIFAVDFADLHLQMQSNGIYCGPGFFQGVYGDIVLATSQRTFDPQQLQQMRDWIAHAYGNNEGQVAEPPTLMNVPGVVIDGPDMPFISGSCELGMNITNTGSGTVQIARFGVTVTTAHPNTYQYQLINACSLLPSEDFCPPELSGRGPTCDDYSATITLPDRQNSGVFEGAVTASDPTNLQQPCPQLTLAAGESHDIGVTFSSPANWAYEAIPQLTIDSAQGERVVTLPGAKGTLAFAIFTQVSCYTLVGQTFVVQQGGFQAPSTWCV